MASKLTIITTPAVYSLSEAILDYKKGLAFIASELEERFVCKHTYITPNSVRLVSSGMGNTHQAFLKTDGETITLASQA